jgi:phenylacetic acid degradation operon negative regulatory protein
MCNTGSVSSVTPKSLVLDLLRVAEPRAIPVRAFVSIGTLFGLTGNAIRVAIARLVASGLLEADEPGSYRLAARTSPLTAHVESWRLGEKRVREWNQRWLVFSLPRGADRADRKRSLRALELLGFREADGLWLRPDNLAEPAERTRERAIALGLDPDARAFFASDADESLEKSWRSLWRVRELDRAYTHALERIEQSSERVERLQPGEAAVETFLVGGAAIRILATDPLLPRELCSVAARKKLAEAMLKYDALGRKVWSRLIGASGLGKGPTHMGVMTGTA